MIGLLTIPANLGPKHGPSRRVPTPYPPSTLGSGSRGVLRGPPLTPELPMRQRHAWSGPVLRLWFPVPCRLCPRLCVRIFGFRTPGAAAVRTPCRR
jgi:hypothetical protein